MADVMKLVNDQARVRILNLLPDLDDLPIGAIIAVARVTDCILIEPSFVRKLSLQEVVLGNYSRGRWAYKLDDVELLEEPYQIRGQQGLWTARFEM